MRVAPAVACEIIASVTARPAAPVALLLACHPVPTIAVTAMATALVASADDNATTVLVAAVAVLTGQLSIGWSNDLIDVRRDRAAGRTDKPLAAGAIASRQVMVATVVALATTVAASSALGWRAGAAQLVVVACGLAYNAGLKSTPVSPVPFFVAFSALPAVATLARPDHAWPPWWALLAGGLIGVAAHFGNVLPDLADDAATGVKGLPHRIGRFPSAATASLCAVAAAVVAVWGADPPRVWGALALVVAVVLAGSGLVLARRRSGSEAAFYTTMVVAALGVTVIAATKALA